MFSLVSIFYKFFPKTYDSILKKGIQNGKSRQREEDREQKQKDRIRHFEYTHEIGKLIIASPNEYDDLIIGRIIEHELFNGSPMAKVHDFLRDEEILLMQKPFPYSECFAECLSNLTPRERHILIYRTDKKFSCINEDTLIGWDKVKAQIKENGYFEELK